MIAIVIPQLAPDPRKRLEYKKFVNLYANVKRRRARAVQTRLPEETSIDCGLSPGLSRNTPWLGMQVAGAAAEVSRAFLRHVLALLVRHLAGTARRALEMVRGRSV